MTSPASAPVLRARATALLLLEIGRRVRWDAIMRDAVSVVLDSIVLVLLLRYIVLMIVCYCVIIVTNIGVYDRYQIRKSFGL